MTNDADKPMRRRLNLAERQSLRATELQLFAKQYAHRAQKDTEPNDRRYNREVEASAKRMRPDVLDALLRDGEE